MLFTLTEPCELVFVFDSFVPLSVWWIFSAFRGLFHFMNDLILYFQPLSVNIRSAIK